MSAPRTSAQQRLGWRDHLVGLALFASYLVLLLATSRDLAMSRDEGFYVTAAERYAGWFQVLFEDPARAADQGVIDSYWSYNSEHPALVKSLFALSWMAQQKWHVFPRDSMAFRFPGMVFGSLLLWLLYVFGARAFGRQAGIFAAVAFALLPRPFYHAHLDCFDIPITFMLTWVTYCYWRSLRSPLWAVITGVAYGLALATKHNAWILPGVLLVHWVWTVAHELRRRRQGGSRLVSLVPWWLVSMLVLGVPIFFASWPWLWTEIRTALSTSPTTWTLATFQRLGDYVGFHLHHIHYNMAFLGVNYFRPPFPKSYPYLMTLWTVPTTTLVLALGGLGRRVRALLPDGVAKTLWPHGEISSDRLCTDVLLFGSLYAPIFVFLMPDAPIFGGTKHWFPAYPFLCLYAGFGFLQVARAMRSFLTERPSWVRHGARLATAALLLAPSAVETIHSHPFGLSHYTYAAGGVPGAADLGLNRQFWGFTTGSLSGYFREQMPHGGTVWICDTTWEAWRMMQRDGMIPDNIQATGDMASADFAIVHIEHHFVEVDFQIWVAFGTVTPSHVLTYDGVPIVDVYENPRRVRR